MQHDLVGEILRGDLVDRRDDVVLRDHDHGRLGVEGDRAEILPVDRKPYESGIGLAAPQGSAGRGGGHRDKGQGDVGQPLVPDPHPLGGRHPGDVREPE